MQNKSKNEQSPISTLEAKALHREILATKNSPDFSSGITRDALQSKQEISKVPEAESLSLIQKIKTEESKGSIALKKLFSPEDEKTKSENKENSNTEPKIKINLLNFYSTFSAARPSINNLNTFKIYTAKFLTDLRNYCLENSEKQPEEILEQLKIFIRNFYVAHSNVCKYSGLSLFGTYLNFTGILQILYKKQNPQEFTTSLKIIDDTIQSEIVKIKDSPAPKPKTFEPKPQTTPKKKDEEIKQISSISAEPKTDPAPSSSVSKSTPPAVLRESKKHEATEIKQTTSSISTEPKSNPTQSSSSSLSSSVLPESTEMPQKAKKETPIPLKIQEKKETKRQEPKKEENPGIILINFDGILNTFSLGDMEDNANDLRKIEIADQKNPAEKIRILEHGQIYKTGDTVIYVGPAPPPKADYIHQKVDENNKFVTNKEGAPTLIPSHKRHIRLDHASLWKDVFSILVNHHFKILPLSARLRDLENSKSPANYVEPMLTSMNAIFTEKRTFLTESDIIALTRQAAESDNQSNKRPIDRLKENNPSPLLEASEKLFPVQNKRRIIFAPLFQKFTAEEKSKYKIIHAKIENLPNPRSALPTIHLLFAALEIPKAIDTILTTMTQHADVLVPLLLEEPLKDAVENTLEAPRDGKETPDEKSARERRKTILDSHKAFYAKFDAKDNKSAPKTVSFLQRGSTALSKEAQNLIAEINTSNDHSALKKLLINAKENLNQKDTLDEKSSSKSKETPISLVNFYLKPRTNKPDFKNKNLDIFNTYTAKFLNDLREYYREQLEESLMSLETAGTHTEKETQAGENKAEIFTIKDRKEIEQVQKSHSLAEKQIKETIHKELQEIISNFYSAHVKDCDNDKLNFAGKTFTLKYFLYQLYVSQDCDEFNLLVGKTYTAVRSKIPEVQAVKIWQRPANLDEQEHYSAVAKLKLLNSLRTEADITDSDKIFLDSLIETLNKSTQSKVEAKIDKIEALAHLAEAKENKAETDEPTSTQLETDVDTPIQEEENPKAELAAIIEMEKTSSETSTETIEENGSAPLNSENSMEDLAKEEDRLKKELMELDEILQKEQEEKFSKTQSESPPAESTSETEDVDIAESENNAFGFARQFSTLSALTLSPAEQKLVNAQSKKAQLMAQLEKLAKSPVSEDGAHEDQESGDSKATSITTKSASGLRPGAMEGLVRSSLSAEIAAAQKAAEEVVVANQENGARPPVLDTPTS